MKKIQSGKSKAGRTNNSKTAMCSKTTTSSKTKKIQVDPESRVLWRTFSIGKWRVNVLINSEKIGHTEERFRSGNEEWMYSKPTSFQLGKEEWIHSKPWVSEKTSFQRRLALENVFDREMKGECIQSQRVFDQEMKSERIHHFREDWLWRTFSIRKWRVNVFKANEFSIWKWRLNVFKATSFIEDFISEKIGSGERFRSGNEEWMYSSC